MVRIATITYFTDASHGLDSEASEAIVNCDLDTLPQLKPWLGMVQSVKTLSPFYEPTPMTPEMKEYMVSYNRRIRELKRIADGYNTECPDLFDYEVRRKSAEEAEQELPGKGR